MALPVSPQGSRQAKARVEQTSFWNRHKVTIVTCAGAAAVVMLAFSILVFPPAAAAFGLTALTVKVSLASLPLTAKILNLVGIACGFGTAALCKIIYDEPESFDLRYPQIRATRKDGEDGEFRRFIFRKNPEDNVPKDWKVRRDDINVETCDPVYTLDGQPFLT